MDDLSLGIVHEYALIGETGSYLRYALYIRYRVAKKGRGSKSDVVNVT